ncbi:hypothetical protein A8H31_13660 [Burkholderia thailandensis]|nr:hypothetical protein A8H31_13660 [Burkholderia thailandensis]NOK43132.1 hypothetical protein [Burkholderia thailandensis]
MRATASSATATRCCSRGATRPRKRTAAGKRGGFGGSEICRLGSSAAQRLSGSAAQRQGNAHREPNRLASPFFHRGKPPARRACNMRRSCRSGVSARAHTPVPCKALPVARSPTR